MKPFQAVILVTFGILALVSVFLVASFSGVGGNAIGKVSVWGSLPKSVMEEVIREVDRAEDGFEGVTYREIAPEAFTATLVEAIAAGRGPDLIVLSASSVVSEHDKVTSISYRTIPRRDFQDAFIEAGEIFLDEEGVLGLPFYVDPYVLYWNRTLFSEAGIARPPRYFDEFADLAPLLSKSTEGGTLTQSAVALGEWGNVNHAKEILTSLIVGLGNTVISKNENGVYVATLTERNDNGVSAAESALRFYTDFADPVKNTYSWNRSLPNSRDAFLAGTVAMYLGRASEVFTLRSGNPNLNFDVAPYPLVRDGRSANPTDLYALSIPRGAVNQKGALALAAALSGASAQQIMVGVTGLPSVRRDVVAENPANPYQKTFNDAALNAFSFFDPNPTLSDEVFERMVEDVSSGRLRIPEAVTSGQSELAALLKVQ